MIKTCKRPSRQVLPGLLLRLRFFAKRMSEFAERCEKKWIAFCAQAGICSDCLNHTGCSQAAVRTTAILILALSFLFSPIVNAEVGTASYYGTNPAKERLNKFTASGQEFSPSRLTAASFQFYKKHVRVRSLRTGREVVVFVNDLGPHPRLKRLIDLTPAAFKRIEGSLAAGLARVEVVEVQP